MHSVYVALILVFVLSGCGSGGDAGDKYERVKVGMSEAQVKEILGPPNQSVEGLTDNMKFWETKDGRKIILVFKDGKVTERNRVKGP